MDLKSYSGRVHSIETMGGVDGPGVRMVVFMQGCPLRCGYCHNPDTWDYEGGTKMSISDIIDAAIRLKPYFNREGGITISGGEPLVQSQFVLEIFKLCRENEIHTALDTSGCIFDEKTKRLLEYTDLVILDIKHLDDEKYNELTGASAHNYMNFFKYCCDKNIDMWLRQVVASGLNDTRDDAVGLAMLAYNRKNIKRIELLPFHNMGLSKWRNLGIKYPYGAVKTPDDEIMQKLNAIIDKITKK